PTQFLQLLSTLDIAWAATTVMVALYWLLDRAQIALFGGVAVVGTCIWAYARYVDEVALGPNGAWRLRASELWEYVLVYDTLVAVVAVGLLFAAINRRADTLS
ncbi:MAG: hypothetical protein HKN91_01230, partial [Acidimicrobiia bacterium]|nr:hypothetical protein [Acidimicrobiia bacterium]